MKSRMYHHVITPALGEALRVEVQVPVSGVTADNKAAAKRFIIDTLFVSGVKRFNLALGDAGELTMSLQGEDAQMMLDRLEATIGKTEHMLGQRQTAIELLKKAAKHQSQGAVRQAGTKLNPTNLQVHAKAAEASKETTQRNLESCPTS